MKHKEYSDRRGNAANAKAALLDSFKTALAAAEIGMTETLAARSEFAKAREERRALREAEKVAEQNRLADEAAAVENEIAQKRAEEQAEKRAASEARQSAQDMRIALVLSDEAARKTARDLRYAKRKAAQPVA